MTRETARRPRIGFLGTGWIGRNRMGAASAAGVLDVAAICDEDGEAADAALALAPTATRVADLDAMLRLGLDGIVIATPSALHADQAVAALSAGAAVFCQKPLGRSEAETRRVVETARRADRLLGLDLSYRHTAAMGAIGALVADGSLGDIRAIDLVFHNAYGPDKPWFFRRELSGGGCVVDLGVHLVDLAFLLTGAERIGDCTSRLLAGTRLLDPDDDAVEDYATATFALGRTVVTLACSWHLPAGRDAVISLSVYGTKGGAAMRNVGGSFFDFEAERFVGTAARPIAAPPDDWGGRAIIAWAERLRTNRAFDPSAERFVAVSHALDRIYRRPFVA